MLERILASFGKPRPTGLVTGRDITTGSTSNKRSQQTSSVGKSAVESGSGPGQVRPEHKIPKGKTLHQAWRLALQFFEGQHSNRVQENTPAIANPIEIVDSNWNTWVDVKFEYKGKSYTSSLGIDHLTKKISWVCSCPHREL